MTIPNIEHPTGRPNFSVVQTDRGLYWFSYQTCVAASINGRRAVRVNDWSATTGKHLNLIDGGTVEAKNARLSSEDFARFLVTVDVNV